MLHDATTPATGRTQQRAARHMRIALRLVVTGIVLCGLLAAVSRIVQPKNNQAEFGQSDPEAHGVLGEPRDSIDVLVLGDSESFCSISPLQLWGEQGITSYVCGTSGQILPLTRSLLLSALSKQHPKVVVLETNCLFRPFRPGFALNRALQDKFPVFEYHNRWKKLRAEDLVYSPQTTWTHELKGFRIKKDTIAADPSGYMAPTDELAPMPRLSELYLRSIARICRDNGTRLVLVSTPSTVNWNTARHNRTQLLAGELGIDYIDFNMGSQRVEIDWATDTCDKGDHLNIYGAQKVTSKLGEILRATYQVPSHANEKAYASWNDAYTRYAKQLAGT